MSRICLALVIFVSLSLLPGCGFFRGDRQGPGFCQRCKDRRGQVSAAPMMYPMGDMGGNCGSTIIPPGAMPGGPFVPGPGMQGEGLPAPRIPKAGIDEGKGKQFELEGASRHGPALSIPAAVVK